MPFPRRCPERQLRLQRGPGMRVVSSAHEHAAQPWIRPFHPPGLSLPFYAMGGCKKESPDRASISRLLQAKARV